MEKQERHWCTEDDTTVTFSEEEQEIVLKDEPKSKQVEARDDDASIGTDRTKTKQAKSVSFDPEVEARLIEKHQELSTDVRNDLWYTADDFRRIQGCTRTTLCLMNTKTEIPPNFEDRFCIRGLEGRTRRAMKYRSKARNAVWNAVFDEQDIQFAKRIQDPMAIAEASSSASSCAQQEARDLALRDELEVRRVDAETSTTTLTSTLPMSLLTPIELCRWTMW